MSKLIDRKDSIKISRGLKSEAKFLSLYELGYAVDTKELLLMTPSGLLPLNNYVDISGLQVSSDNRLMTADKTIVGSINSVVRLVSALDEVIKSNSTSIDVIKKTMDNLIIDAGNSNAEIVDARTDNHGNNYSKLGDRLDHISDILSTSQEDLTTSQATIVSNLRNTEGFISKLVEVTKTYTDNFSKLKYGNTYTAYDKVVTQVDGKYELDCSSFISLLIHGVTYHNSRYNGNETNKTSPLFFNNIDSNKYRYANQIAKYCVDNGYHFYPNSDLSNIRAGDLVFFSWRDKEGDEFHENAFMKIDHVAMYLDRKNDNIHRTIQYERYTPEFMYDASNDYMSQCILVARLPFANIENYSTSNIVVNGNSRKECTNSIEVGTYYLSEPLVPGELYTLSLNGKVLTDNCYFLVQVSGSTVYSDYGRDSTDGTLSFYFIYTGSVPSYELKLLVGCTDSNNLKRSAYVNWCIVNRGYRLVNSTPQFSGVYNSRELALTDYIKDKLIDNHAVMYKVVETTTHYAVTLNLAVDKDFLSNEIVIGNLHSSISSTVRLPCNLVDSDNNSSNGILQFKWNGEISIIKYDSKSRWKYAMSSGIVFK